uniref:Uncharacterized protein n=1 Tax=Romanomermis culicivorax TaxID=13658 RepID=A0A915JGM4_ROMCU
MIDSLVLRLSHGNLNKKSLSNGTYFAAECTSDNWLVNCNGFLSPAAALSSFSALSTKTCKRVVELRPAFNVEPRREKFMLTDVPDELFGHAQFGVVAVVILNINDLTRKRNDSLYNIVEFRLGRILPPIVHQTYRLL